MEPSRYRYLPTIDSRGGVRWDPISMLILSLGLDHYRMESPGTEVSVAALMGGSATWLVDQSLRPCARHHRGYLPVTPGTLASGRTCIGRLSSSFLP